MIFITPIRIIRFLTLSLLLFSCFFPALGSAAVVFTADYETNNFNQWPIKQKCCAYSQTISSTTVRAGSFAGRFELRDTDPHVANGTRTEVAMEHPEIGNIGGADNWYGFSIFLPTTHVDDDYSGSYLGLGAFDVLTQWHNAPDPGTNEVSRNPQLWLVTDGGKWKVVRRVSGTKVQTTVEEGQVYRHDLGAYTTNEWTNWVFNVRFSCRDALPIHPDCQAMPTGFLKVWKNGALVLNIVGPTSYNDVSRINIKQGIYKGFWNGSATTNVSTRVVYHDETRIGNSTSSFAEVSPGGSPPPVDTTPPSTPTNLQLVVESESSIRATWTASTDTGGSGLAGYNLEHCAGAACTPTTVTPVSTNSHLLTGLQPDTVYRIRVQARDGADNVSTKTVIVEATTPINLLRVTNRIADSGNFASNRPWQALFDGTKSDAASAGNVGITSFFVEHDLGELTTLEEAEVTGDADGVWLCGTGGAGGGFTLQYKANVGDAYTTVLNNVNCRSNSTTIHDLGDVVGRYIKHTWSCAGCQGTQGRELLLLGTPAPDVPVPDTPTGFMAQVQSQSAIFYDWQPASGAVLYNFYFCEGAACTLELIDTPSQPPLVVDFLNPGMLYRAQVAAVNTEGEESARTAILEVSTPTVTTNERFVSADGTGDCLTITTPCTFPDVWTTVSAGDVIIALTGDYTGPASLIFPPDGKTGTANAPITIQAQTDGGVDLDCTGQSGAQGSCIYLRETNDWYIIEGFDVHEANTNVIVLAGDRNILRRVVAWDGGQANATDSAIIRVPGDFNLIEDVAAFGRARVLFNAAHGGDDNTFRRVFGRWEERLPCCEGSLSAIKLFHNHYRMTVENAIMTRGDINTTQSGTHHELYSAEGGVSGGNTNRVAGSRVLGSIAYIPSGVTAPTPGCFAMAQASDFEFRDVACSIENGQTGKVAFTLGEPVAGPYDLALTRAVGVAPAASTISANWTQTDVGTGESVCAALGSPVTSVWTHAPGLCQRYQDGVLTTDPLWPWPMDGRIQTAFVKAGKEPLVTGTVTSEMEAAFGDIPDVCRSTGGEEEPEPDTTAPTVPENLTVVAQNANQTLVTADESLDLPDLSTPCCTYLLDSCAGAGCTPTFLIELATPSHLHGMLLPDTLYRYRIAARDAQGNVSDKSDIVEEMTPAGGADMADPTAPTVMEITPVSSSQLDLTCSGATDNIGIAGYRLRRCSMAGCNPSTPDQVFESATCAFSDTALIPNRSYLYSVTAFDAAGNESPLSDPRMGVTPGLVGVMYGIGWR